MTSLWRSAGWVVGGVLGTVVTTATAAITTQHRRIAAQRKLAAERGTDKDDKVVWLPPDREFTVAADDGVLLSVEEVDPTDGGSPELTVVLVHGYTLDRRCWLFQRLGLARSTAPRIRQVFYDHRSHGRSGRSPRHACTIEQLGRDLDAVIRAAAPEGPVVLIGHSLGGMTIMALAEHHPELFAARIAGVAFLNTSAGDIGRSGLPRPVLSRRNPVMPVAKWLSRWPPGALVVERGRDLGEHVVWGLIRKLAFGDETVSPALVELMTTMMRTTSFEVMTDFLATFGAHNRYAALAGLQYVKALVLGSDGDRLVQYEHSEAIAALLPDAELVRVHNSGHMTMLEQPELVNGHLMNLLSRCSGQAGRLPLDERSGMSGLGRAALEECMRQVRELPAPADTEQLGRAIGARLRAGDVVVLSGPLGAGKTVLARGIGAGLGVRGPVTSPTFVIAREHPPLPGGRGLPLVHVDAYRLGGLAELDDLDLDTDLLTAAVVVEWGEGMAERLADEHLLIRLRRGSAASGDASGDDSRIAELIGPERLLPEPACPTAGNGCYP